MTSSTDERNLTTLGIVRDGRPALSVIVATPDNEIGAIIAVIRCLVTQSIADQIEVIAVAPSTMQSDIPADCSRPLHSLKLLRVPVVANLAEAKMKGIKAFK